MTPLEILQDWIRTAAAGKLKVGKRELSKGECELVVELLQAVAADMLMAKE